MPDTPNIPGPILAAWLAVLCRQDLAPQFLNSNPSDPAYKALLASYSFTADQTNQWNGIVAKLRDSDISMLTATQQLYSGLMNQGGYPFACPGNSQLKAIANSFAAEAHAG